MNEKDRLSRIRNFSIIAHIDHGKTTLTDRILEQTGLIDPRKKVEQFLDRMDIEKERGITIKAQAVRIPYPHKDNPRYYFNLIDTPGHVDFTYEVSRSLKACEGALLVVDASQGVEAQTLANVYLALEHDLEIIPVINKIDLPSADPDRVRKEIEEVIGLPGDDAILCSAKTGEGIDELLKAVVERIPAPTGDSSKPLEALIFDSWFDSYQGVIVLSRVFNGRLKVGDRMLLMASGQEYEVTKLGAFSPNAEYFDSLNAGDVGFIIANIKEISHAKVGDTITLAENPAPAPLEGFREMKPMVFAGLYPSDSDDYEALRDALSKLKLNDYSLIYEPENSIALGFGFRCGFLGLLHMEIVQERLEREYGVALITTAPTVIYKVYTKKGEMLEIDNPAKMPDATLIDKIEEPIISAKIHTPNEFVGNIIKLCEDRRGVQKHLEYVTTNRVIVEYELPLNEIMLDFYDRLKSVSKGYASLDYEFIGYKEADLVKVDMLVNGDPVDALSFISHRDKARVRGLEFCKKLKEIIPRQQFEVAIQAAIGSKIIARTTVRAYRKDVTAKCYGGDITRKRKLLEKQKEGKKRMKSVGNVEIPQEAFLAVLKIDD